MQLLLWLETLQLLEYQWSEGEFDKHKQTSSDPTRRFRQVYAEATSMVGDEGGLGWVCEAERLSKQSFAARVSLQSGQICIDVITLRHTTFLAEICSA